MKKVICLLAVVSSVTVAFVSAQENAEPVKTKDADIVTFENEIPIDAVVVSVSPEGKLAGKVFQNIGQNEQGVTARVTISKLNGETVAISSTTDTGDFEFESVEPGHYTIIGVGPGYYGDEVINVKPHNAAYTSMIPVQVAPVTDAGAVYATYQDTPISTFSTAPGFNGSFHQSTPGGGRGLFRGRGRFGLRSLLPLVGLVGLTGISNDDDTSPTL